MPVIAEGSSAVVTVSPGQILNVSSPNGLFTVEAPIGNFQASSSGTGTFGPFSSPTVRVNAINRSAYYEVTGQRTVPTNTATPMTISGTYVGDGTASKAIALPFIPDFVEIKGDAASIMVRKSRNMWMRQTDAFSQGSASRIGAITLTDTGFTVNADVTVNTTGTTYYYTAVADNGSGVFHARSHHGNATAGRILDQYNSLDKLPLWVEHKRDATQSPVLTMRGASLSYLEDGTSGSYALLDSNGLLTLDASDETNQWLGISGEACNHVGYSDDPDNVCLYTYTGNGQVRNISLPWEPESFKIWPLGSTGSKIHFWNQAMPAGSIGTSNNVALQTGRVTAVNGTTITLAAVTSVNATGIGFAVLAIRKRRQSFAATPPAKVTRRQASIQLGGNGNPGYIDCGQAPVINGNYTVQCYAENFTPISEAAITANPTVNDDPGKQHPLVWWSNGADGGSSTTTIGGGLALICPPIYAVGGIAWTGNSYHVPRGAWFNMAVNGSANLDYAPLNTGIVQDGGKPFNAFSSMSSSGRFRFNVFDPSFGRRALKTAHRDLTVVAGGPMKPNGAYPLTTAKLCIGARFRASLTTPDFQHYLNVNIVRIWNRTLTDAEVRAVHLADIAGLPCPVRDGLVREYDAKNASGTTIPDTATTDSIYTGTIVNGKVLAG